MTFERALAIGENDLRLVRRDPVPVVVLIAMPLLLMSLLKPAFEIVLSKSTGQAANGADQVVPGMAIVFGGLLVNNIGFGFFREHGWTTWDRLRTSAASPPDIVLGKLLTPALIIIAQQITLLGVGGAMFGLQVDGSLLALVLCVLALALLLVTLTMALVSITRTVAQFGALSSLAAFVFAGLGGALVPTALLPVWAQVIGRLTPTYWLMRAFEIALQPGGTVTEALIPLAVVGLFCALFSGLFLFRFRVEETRTAWA